MSKREELFNQLYEQYEHEFFQQNGFIMNSQQKKTLKKKLEKIVDRKMKSIERLMW